MAAHVARLVHWPSGAGFSRAAEGFWAPSHLTGLGLALMCRPVTL